MVRVVSKKMGIKEGARAFLVNAPPEAIEAIALPEVEMADRLTGDFDYIHLFAESQDDLRQHIQKLKTHLKPDGMLWVSWPKGGQLGTDLSLPTVIRLGYDQGLVESKTLSIDSTWSAMKFTRPKKNKVYRNSYGTLQT
jgi:hypothetical protein